MPLFWSYMAFFEGKKGLIQTIVVQNILYNARFGVKKRDIG